ncbi:hypothetical protein JR316_0006215 [Psilocybe cubensis]|uniref:Uncharacterized protein n=2 Tax=Psilocybe cubensis TaxID=181762 RepID=A0A8H7Y122_PSICU|nr:hypothetical protein JR316_0006215 [Psilocybe cubensis]KAH9481688.1 hypothetical protein JR316_0006215 [Psilocybe cubensis]
MNSSFDKVPLEISDMIIDSVAQDDDGKCTNLKNCSMACKGFLPRCRKHIFTSIEVTTRNLVRFVELVDNSPRIALCIRSLSFFVDLDAFNKIPSISLQYITNIRLLSVQVACGEEESMWTRVNPPVRSAVLRLMCLPTLSALGLCCITGIPPSCFVSCHNLECYVHAVEFGYDEYDTPVTISPSATSKSTNAIKLRRLVLVGYVDNLISTYQRGKMIGRPLFDLSGLEQVTFHLSDLEQFLNIDQLLYDSHNLETVQICMENISMLNCIESFVGIFLPSLKNLHIHISSLSLISSGVDTISLLCQQIQTIAHDNVIQYLSLNLLADHNLGLRLEEFQWDAFDQVLLAPNQWLSLEQFDLWVYVNYSAEHPVDKPAFEKLVENVRASKISNLISNKLFKFRAFFDPDPQDHYTYFGA